MDLCKEEIQCQEINRLVLIDQLYSKIKSIKDQELEVTTITLMGYLAWMDNKVVCAVFKVKIWLILRAYQMFQLAKVA